MGALLGAGTILLASCTANFCNEADQAQMAYPYEQGATVYLSRTDYEELKVAEATKDLILEEEAQGIAGQAMEGNKEIYKYIPYVKESVGYTLTAKKAEGFLQASIIKSAISNGLKLPSIKYWAAIDDFTLKAALYASQYGAESYEPGRESTPEFNAGVTLFGDRALLPYTVSDSDGTEGDPIKTSILRVYGYLKFTDKNGNLWGNFTKWNDELYASADPYLGIDNVPTKDFYDFYKSSVNSKVTSIRSCIATRDGNFGHYGSAADWEVAITYKSWGYAWSKGFFEGLLVYPVAFLVDSIAFGIDPALSGTGQILALLIVTIIVRGLLLRASFRSTMDNQKMQALQPELAKLQAKYPNSNTNQAEKQRLSQEQMALYKRHGIKPFRQFLILLVQFPVFICVWAGLQGSAALSTGQFLNLRLSDTIQQTLFNVTTEGWYFNVTGWWTALILFLLMAGTQVMAMMLPRIIAKRRAKGVARLTKNPAQDQSQSSMKMMSIIMMIFTIVMGFMLPSAMGVYWFIGGLISVAQTLITQFIIGKKAKKRDK